MAEYYRRGGRFWITYQLDGKRIRKPLKTKEGRPVKDEKIANYITNEIENQISKGDSPIPILNLSPKDILDQYRQYYYGIVNPRVIVNNCGAIERFLDSTNPLNISSINEQIVRKYLDNRIFNKEISNLTANNIIKYIKAFLNFAIKRNYLKENKIARMSQYKVDVLPPKYLKKEEISQILSSAREEVLYKSILIAIYTGMRLGEIRRLKWSDFNFENGTITIFQSKAGKYRTIPIHPALRILNKNDLPFNFQNHQRVFKRIRKKANLNNIGWHTFRHTFITHLILNGVDLATVQKIAGHSSIETTMIYTHVSQDHAKESITKIDFGS